MNYNLVDENWIPVLYTDGRYDRVGIRKAFLHAGKIRQIAASNPMDRVAILRFLLAVLYWCKGNPPDDVNASLAGQAGFPDDWLDKLGENRECFNLLGEGKRFYQDPDALRSRGVTDLLQEIPTGNNFWHFRHATDEKDCLCLKCCAMGLLRLPLFSVSGLPDLKSGINGTPPVYVVPHGNTLLQTILLNWRPSVPLGEPVWIEPNAAIVPGQQVPLLAGLTMLSRRVWLHDPEQSGTCIACGAMAEPTIRMCEFQTAGSQQNEQWSDPHVLYSDTTPRKTSKAADLTASQKFRMDRPWPDLFSNLSNDPRFNRTSAHLLVGFATDKAKNIDVWERNVRLTPIALTDEESGDPFQQWKKECWRLEKLASRSEKIGLASIASLRPQVEDAVSRESAELMCGSNAAWVKASNAFRPMMSAAAKSLSPGFTLEAVTRQKQIANATPDMRPKAKAAKKGQKKKGGDK